MAIKIKETVKFEKLEDGKFQLDVRSYVCPHVQIYAEKALKKIGSGDEITIVFDNPSSGESIRYLCANNGDEILQDTESAGTFTWKIRKA